MSMLALNSIFAPPNDAIKREEQKARAYRRIAEAVTCRHPKLQQLGKGFGCVLCGRILDGEEQAEVPERFDQE